MFFFNQRCCRAGFNQRCCRACFNQRCYRARIPINDGVMLVSISVDALFVFHSALMSCPIELTLVMNSIKSIQPMDHAVIVVPLAWQCQSRIRRELDVNQLQPFRGTVFSFQFSAGGDSSLVVGGSCVGDSALLEPLIPSPSPLKRGEGSEESDADCGFTSNCGGR